MNPAAIALKDELGKLDAPLPVHLLYELEQAAVIGLVACDDIRRAAEHVVTVLHTPNERVEFLTAVARGHHDGLAPRFADGVEELVYEYVQQVYAHFDGRLSMPSRSAVALAVSSVILKYFIESILFIHGNSRVICDNLCLYLLHELP